MMKNSLTMLIMLLIFSINGVAGELQTQEDSGGRLAQADTTSLQQNLNSPEKVLVTGEEQDSSESAYVRRKREAIVSMHKVNFVALNRKPWDYAAQLKFQISIKYQLLKPDPTSSLDSMFPAYFGYTQKSLWDIGQHSGPLVESNYNPEIFLDYPIDTVKYGPLHLRNIVISPFEHESNGLATTQSRSWNRQYVMARFGLPTTEPLDESDTFIRDKALFYVKVWRASGYLALEHYLQSIGSSDTFLDYMGRGEVGFSVRNFLWGGKYKDHQLDIKTSIFRDMKKDSYLLEFRQQLQKSNFALYLNYWLGYGETLMQFDQHAHRAFIGFAVSN